MKLNAEKCEFLITGHRFEHLWLNFGETQVWEKNQVKLLGITIDNELKFDDHITKICRKANIKLSFYLDSLNIYQRNRKSFSTCRL